MIIAAYCLCTVWFLLVVWLVHGVLTQPQGPKDGALTPPKDGDAS